MHPTLGHRTPVISDSLDDPLVLDPAGVVGVLGTSPPSVTADSIVLFKQSEQTSDRCRHEVVGGCLGKNEGSPLHITHSSPNRAGLLSCGTCFFRGTGGGRVGFCDGEGLAIT